MLQLLRDIAVDATRPVGDDNPLRQVLINTHSPLVVGEVESDELLLAEPTEVRTGGVESTTLRLSPLSGTWRAKLDGAQPVARGKLLEYLSPPRESPPGSPRRVLDRPEVQLALFGDDAAE
jgi:hypothetical protein